MTDDDDRRSTSSTDHTPGGVANGDDEKRVNMVNQLVNKPLASVATTTSANDAPEAIGESIVVGRSRLPGGLGVEDAKKLVSDKIGGGGGPGAIRARREQAELAAQVSREKKRDAVVGKKGGKGALYYDSNGHLVGGHLDTARLMNEIRPKAAAASAAHRTFSANETGVGQLKVSRSCTPVASGGGRRVAINLSISHVRTQVARLRHRHNAVELSNEPTTTRPFLTRRALPTAPSRT